jgi:hypothetical protein
MLNSMVADLGAGNHRRKADDELLLEETAVTVGGTNQGEREMNETFRRKRRLPRTCTRTQTGWRRSEVAGIEEER